MLIVMKKLGVILIHFVLVLIFNYFSISSFSQSSDNSIQVSLLTQSPGEKLYSMYGHSSIRIRNSSANTDEVYNYGTFDFNDPSFYFGFIRGKLNYTLSRVPFQLVFEQTRLEKRVLIETPLNLSPDEKAKMLQLLKVHYLPDNREYQYDFLYNNCSSKILDLIVESTADSLEYNQLAVPKKSFRKLLHNYSNERPWSDIGIDFLLGAPADRRAKGMYSSFLPDYLHMLLKNIRIKEDFGFEKSLAQSDIVHTNYPARSIKIAIQPGLILWPLVLILLISAIFGTYIQGFFRIFEKFLYIFFGSLGVIMIGLWAATDHYIFNFNTDLLWANPLLLFIVFLKDTMTIIKIKVFITYLATLFVFLGIITTMIIEQNFNLTAIAAMIAISLLNKIYLYRTTDNDPFYNVN